LRVKEDAIPGRTNYLWFNADKLGTYEIACAEYCGLDHWNMYSKLVVIPQEKFYEWYNASTDTVKTTTSTINTQSTNDTLKTSAGSTDTTKKTTDSVKTNNKDTTLKKDSVK